jgi:hypothetical protein
VCREVRKSVPGSTVERAGKYGRTMPYFTVICGKGRAGKYGCYEFGMSAYLEKTCREVRC